MTAIGSLCSGYGGLELGLEAFTGGRTVWHVEYDKHPSAILAHRFPGVPNHGDVKHTDWTQVEPVDWLTAGYPCQPFSHAGKRGGADDPRHLWPDVARCIGVLRPRRVLLENVAGHLSLGFDTVLGDLAALGYDATWGVVRASDAGAPHGRARLFVVAADTAGGPWGVGHRDDVRAGSGTDRLGPAPARGVATDAERSASGQRHDADLLWGRQGDAEQARLGNRTPPDASCDGRGEGRPEPAGLVGGPHAAAAAEDNGHGESIAGRPAPQLPWLASSESPASDTDGRGREERSERDSDSIRGLAASRGDDPDGLVAWGAYAPAIARWEHVTGRPAPRPTEPGRNGERLSPRFVEWMQGLPAGWVIDVGLPRNAQLKVLGNGCVPQQVALALRFLDLDEATA